MASPVCGQWAYRCRESKEEGAEMMKFGIVASLLATAIAAPAPAQTPERGIEDGYGFGWYPVKADPADGTALFVTQAERAGDAVQFAMLIVYRDVQRHTNIGAYGAEFDKEIFRFLGDCRSGMLLEIGYSFQKQNEAVPVLMNPVYTAELPPKDSPRNLALAAACRAVSADPTRTPYSWARERLGRAAQ
jgi:hypothetical protein